MAWLLFCDPHENSQAVLRTTNSRACGSPAARAPFCDIGLAARCGDHLVTHEEALENAIAALRQRSEGKIETGAILAAIAELVATSPPPKRNFSS